MAFTGYLKIEGVDGESMRADHEGNRLLGRRIQRQPAQQLFRRLGPHPRPRHAERFHLPQVDGRCVSVSAAACARVKSFAEIVFTVRKEFPGDAHLDYLIITLTNCIISGYRMAQSATEEANQEVISETIEISYEKLNFKYVVQADDHSKGDEHEVEYDLVAAK